MLFYLFSENSCSQCYSITHRKTTELLHMRVFKQIKETVPTTMSRPINPPHCPSMHYLLLTILLLLIPVILSAMRIQDHLPQPQPKPPSFITSPPSSPPVLTSYTPPSSSVTTGSEVAILDPTPTHQGHVPRRYQQTLHHTPRIWTGTGGPPYDDPPM